MIGALGVVYGDIGTSPLYTLKVCLDEFKTIDAAHVLGILSLLFWLLMVVVSFKYVMLIMRADNRGEGGTLALLELAVRGVQGHKRTVLVVLGIFGAALFYGDSMITPAISVISAVEGIGIVSHSFDGWIVPISLAVLIVLFAFQSRGTASVGKLFGPIMCLWFVTLAATGIASSIAVIAPSWRHFTLRMPFRCPRTARRYQGARRLRPSSQASLPRISRATKLW